MRNRSTIFDWRAREPERPLLDAAYLARLEAHVGAIVLAELLADGLIELIDRLARLDELTVTGDLDGIARLGHDLVGMAGHLGLARLSVAAAGMNRAARDGGPGGAECFSVASAVTEIRELGAASAAEIRKRLQGTSGS